MSLTWKFATLLRVDTAKLIPRKIDIIVIFGERSDKAPFFMSDSGAYDSAYEWAILALINDLWVPLIKNNLILTWAHGSPECHWNFWPLMSTHVWWRS